MKFKTIILLLIFNIIINISYTQTTECFTDSNPLNGYITSYETTAFQVNIIENGVIEKQSFSMSGIISLNFASRSMFDIFTIDNEDGSTVNIETYTFGQNSTQYIVIDSKCYLQQPLSVPFPSSLQVKPINNSNTTIGGIPVSQFQVLDLGNVKNAQQILYVNAQTCDFIYTSIKNTDSFGSALTNFHNFQQELVESKLPSSCYNASPITKQNNNIIQSLLSFK